MRIDLVAHIVAGSLGIVFGFVALFAAKGGRVHRKGGMLFVYAMLVMALVGSAMAVVRGVAPAANGPVGLLTAYLVVTALATVRPPTERSHQLHLGLLVLVLGVTVTLGAFGVAVLRSATGKLYGMPAFPFLIFAGIGLLALAGDVRLMRAGGVQTIRGTARLTRHLWRMCVALLIAAFSFFLGQAKVIPKPIRIVPLLLIPPLVVLAALLYWLWRVRIRKTLRGMVFGERTPSARAAPLTRLRSNTAT